MPGLDMRRQPCSKNWRSVHGIFVQSDMVFSTFTKANDRMTEDLSKTYQNMIQASVWCLEELVQFASKTGGLAPWQAASTPTNREKGP